MINGRIGVDDPSDIIWIDRVDEGDWTMIADFTTRKPQAIPAWRCDQCGIVEMHFPPGALAEALNKE